MTLLPVLRNVTLKSNSLHCVSKKVLKKIMYKKYDVKKIMHVTKKSTKN